MSDGTDAGAVSLAPKSQRKLRNYLLDSSFQLKYTWPIVVVSTAVASSVGVAAHKIAELSSSGTATNDRSTLIFTMAGLLVGLVLLLFVSGIYITHRIVGPAYKLRRLFQKASEGQLKLEGRLRSGDELQEVFLDFEKMLLSMESKRRELVDELDGVIVAAEEAALPVDLLQRMRALRTDLNSGCTRSRKS